MDTRHLQAFKAVYENGSMSAAAAVLKKSQPAISNLVARLEDEIGLSLFKRTGGRVTPTPEAAAFYLEIGRALDSLEHVVAVARDLRGLASATLLIASPPGLATYVLPPVIAGLLADHPGTTARFITRSSSTVRDLGSMGAFDVGFAELPIDRPVSAVEMFETRCVCVMPADHPLARHPVLTPRLLDKVPFVALFREHITHLELANAFFAAGAHWNVTAEAEFFGTACVLALEGAGVTMVDPPTGRHFERIGMVVRPFAPAIPYRFAMFRPSGRPPSMIAAEFITRFRAGVAGDLVVPPGA